MKYLLVLIMILASKSYAQELPENSKEQAKPVKVSSKKNKPRKPAQTKVEPEVKPRNYVYVGVAYYQGGIYFGGLKTPADFSYVSLGVLTETKSMLDYGFQVGHLFNKSAVKSYDGMVYVGGRIRKDHWTFRAGPQIGLAMYQEKTNIQNASAFGPVLGAKIQVEYQVSQNLNLVGSYNWHHSMFASSFWGKDVFSDVVLDFLGPQVSLSWSF